MPRDELAAGAAGISASPLHSLFSILLICSWTSRIRPSLSALHIILALSLASMRLLR